MKQGFVAQKSITINASPEEVWEALTNPAKIKEYLFGTDTVTDWKPGGDIRWKGQWEGKSYEDKGKILSAEKGKELRYTYWSSMSGKEDKPENYATVTTSLHKTGNATVVTIVQDGNDSEKSKDHSEGNWAKVLEGLKKVVESPR